MIHQGVDKAVFGGSIKIHPLMKSLGRVYKIRGSVQTRQHLPAYEWNPILSNIAEPGGSIPVTLIDNSTASFSKKDLNSIFQQ